MRPTHVAEDVWRNGTGLKKGGRCQKISWVCCGVGDGVVEGQNWSGIAATYVINFSNRDHGSIPFQEVW